MQAPINKLFNVDKSEMTVDENDKLIKNALTVILNSIEFTSTELRFSPNKHTSNLLQLTVSPENSEGTKVYVSGLYTVTDGKKSENRCFNGLIGYQTDALKQNTSLSIFIQRLNTPYKTIFLEECFTYIPFTECTSSIYSYLGITSGEREFVVLSQNSAEEFLEEELKLINKRS